MTNVVCNKCGKEIPDNSKLCNLCGTSISSETQPVKTSREIPLKETYEKKYSIPQLEESIESLKQKKILATIFFIASLILTFATLGLGIFFTILSTENMTHYNIHVGTYDELNRGYIILASLFFSLFVIFLAASIALPILNATLIKKNFKTKSSFKNIKRIK